MQHREPEKGARIIGTDIDKRLRRTFGGVTLKDRWALTILVPLLIFLLTACGSSNPSADSGDNQRSGSDLAATTDKEPIKFGDAQWQTLWINNAIAKFIIEHGYGYPVEIVTVTTPVMQASLPKGDLDVYMELWHH
ncbi:MAG TPA: glycine betaine ABC transporter substrate-binding protein, partial [Bacillota bacterium]